ncbi:F-box/LRR-repeat protein At4g14103-like [Papaver somniferum]|uniref:F-box/LRR-repeat protein At4g14103-like n=1 Tax=Papaver somniferum TaxID=3469 RepID=UPI000E6F5B9C|nr:F-box/LRR-repeat protein At4g14103-like [Papaver somniferum]
MDLKKQKLLHTERHNNIGEAEDRISELPDSVLHRILSFLDIKHVARTCILSKRWKYIWASIPTLDLSRVSRSATLSEINKLMDFVDRTLLLHDTSSSIQKFHLHTNIHMSVSRVHSWISNITKRNVKELDLYLDFYEPFFIPLSLFTCESLIKLELALFDATDLPRSFCFPKLKSLKLCGIQFTNDDCWNEQHFSYCPVLENLILEECTWFGVSNFCISTPMLKLLEIENNGFSDGLPDCSLKVHAPNLVSLSYYGCVAKKYVFSCFQKLKFARVCLTCKKGAPWEQNIAYRKNITYGAAVRRFIRAVAHVQSLTLYPEALKAVSIVYDLGNILPIFHYLKELILKVGITTDESLFWLLKAVPNLRVLVFEEGIYHDEHGQEKDSWARLMLTEGCLFQHLQTLFLGSFNRDAREMRWLKLILESARSLQTISISDDMDAKSEEELISELQSLPRASEGCEFKIVPCD